MSNNKKYFFLLGLQLDFLQSFVSPAKRMIEIEDEDVVLVRQILYSFFVGSYKKVNKVISSFNP